MRGLSVNQRSNPSTLFRPFVATRVLSERHSARLSPERCLARAATSGAKAFDLASFRRRDVVRTASHLAHEPLLLHLAAELPKRLLELLGILDDYAHNPQRIPVGGRPCSVKPRRVL